MANIICPHCKQLYKSSILLGDYTTVDVCIHCEKVLYVGALIIPGKTIASTYLKLVRALQLYDLQTKVDETKSD